ncbi:MAG: hypothetical protein HOD63_15535 [Bacteroidetes bacterium]|jgi:hypothetical protein|nr:hypothetical protein [Bacteroidota bacterium]MBT7996148.1 hypothetical protein [Bacteroidota bacterium]
MKSDIKNKVSIPEGRKEIWEKVIKFLNDNHQIVIDYHIIRLKINMSQDCPKKRLRTLFIMAYDSNSSGRLDNKATAVEKFFNIIDKLDVNKDNLINWNDFLDNLGISTSEEVFARLVVKHKKSSETKKLERDYPGFAEKKAAIFLRDLFIIHNESEFNGNKVFKNFDLNKSHLKVPFDIVICDLINIILQTSNKIVNSNSIIEILPFEKKEKRPNVYLVPGLNGFNKINNFAIEVFGKDLIILEDLWFWGYFNSKTKKLSKTQSKKNIEFNSSKYNTDLYMYPGVICKTSKFDEFRELLYEKK